MSQQRRLFQEWSFRVRSQNTKKPAELLSATAAAAAVAADKNESPKQEGGEKPTKRTLLPCASGFIVNYLSERAQLFVDR